MRGLALWLPNRWVAETRVWVSNERFEAAVRKTQSGPLLCITNVHIFPNPKFPDVKLWQTHALVKQVC